ncbi:MAG: glycosyltransferase family 39 protein [Nibricoccus sp.]
MTVTSRIPAAVQSLLQKRITVFLLSAALTLLAVSTAFRLVWPVLSAHAELPGRPAESVEMPWQFHHASLGNKLYVELDVGLFTTRTWRIIPDDDLVEITVNGTPVSLTSVRPGGLSDYTYGFEIDLTRYLWEARNKIVFYLDNHGGDGGLNMRPVLGSLRWSLIGLSFLPLLLGLAWLFRLHYTQIALLVSALVVLCCYWAATPWGMRSHDVGGGGHLEYITYIANRHALPNPMEGWTFYHPPLYYIAGALTWAWAKWLALPAPECVQGLSLALWLVFLTASAGTLRLALRGRPGALFAATALVALWPSGIIHGLRIGNDAAFYAAAGIATWFMVRWWRSRRRRDVCFLSLAIAAAFLCKSNAMVLAAAAGLLLGSAVVFSITRRKAQKFKPTLADLAIFTGLTGTGFALSFAVRVYYYLQGNIHNWFISNIDSLGGSLSVPVDVKSFLPLDIPTFLTQPWLETGNDATGRWNFWNYLLRSSLSGEFSFPGELHRALALAWGAVLLGLCLVVVRRFVNSLACRNIRQLYIQLPWLLLTVLWLASVAALRYKAPFACSNDFRYVLPVIVPAAFYWANGGHFTRILMCLMSILSVVFFTTL